MQIETADSAVELTVEIFEALQGELLRVDTAESAQELRLEKVRRLAHPFTSERVPFALDFSGSAAEPLHQGTYAFFHKALGSQPIFIVPVAQNGLVRLYEAIFN